jgi:hypothetical protein
MKIKSTRQVKRVLSILDLGAGLDSFRSGLRDLVRRTFGVDADELAAAALVFKFLDEREQRVVLTLADVVAGLPLGSTLAGNDVAAENVLSPGFLEAKPLCVRVASVS